MTQEHHERLAAIEKSLAVIQVITANMAEDLKDTKRAVSELSTDTKRAIERVHVRMDNEFVSQKEFWPIKMLVFGGTSLMLAALLGALVALVIKR